MKEPGLELSLKNTRRIWAGWWMGRMAFLLTPQFGKGHEKTGKIRSVGAWVEWLGWVHGEIQLSWISEREILK